MTWWHYLLLVNIYLLLFYGFYALLLRRETFFQLNRIYLVGAALLSFFIPMIQSDWIQSLFITQEVQSTLYGAGPSVNIIALAPIKDSSYTLGQLFVMLYAAGVVFLAFRLMWQFVLLRRVIKQAIPSAPYSFFNTINVDEEAEGSDVILAHEQVHAKQWHSADVLIVEAVMIINWFNPVVYLYRSSIKHIHEYIADRQALLTGTSKADYALLLLSQSFNTPAHTLVTPFFNQSLLKQRILMLQRSKSARIKLLKYGLSAPLFAVMLVLSSATINDSNAIEEIHEKTAEVMSRTATTIIPTEEQPVTLLDFDLAASSSDAAAVSGQQEGISIEEAKQGSRSASFPGGSSALSAYLANAVQGTQDDNKLSGRMVLSCIVDETGNVTNIKVIKSLGRTADVQAIKALKASPKWTPAMKAGKVVKAAFTIPVNFVADEPAPIKIDAAPDVVADNNSIFAVVEQQPTFPGGEAAFGRYINENVNYPVEARQNNIQGRLIATFVVEKDGAITNLKILRGLGYGLDEEGLRVLSQMPKWQPGQQNGHAARVQYSVPITFTLSDANQVQGATATKKQFPGNENEPLFAYDRGKLKGTDNNLDGNYAADNKATVSKTNNYDLQRMDVLKYRTSLQPFSAKGSGNATSITRRMLR